MRGDAADARSDLYSLGCVLYEMVTGALPFESPSDFALMRAHAEQAPPRPIVRCGDLPAALEGVILRALEKQPARRFASAREFLDALSAVCGAAPPAPATRPALSADALRRHAALAREHATAAIRWLSLPTRGGWQDWRAWARLNLGLTTAAGVAAAAVVLGLAVATHEACCSVRPVVQPVRWNNPEPLPQPAPAVEVAQPEPAPAPLPALPPRLVAEPGAQGGTSDPMPLSRSVRPVPVVAPAAPKVKVGEERPSSPGWYVKR